jgi:hypothetical protein
MAEKLPTHDQLIERATKLFVSFFKNKVRIPLEEGSSSKQAAFEAFSAYHRVKSPVTESFLNYYDRPDVKCQNVTSAADNDVSTAFNAAVRIAARDLSLDADGKMNIAKECGYFRALDNVSVWLDSNDRLMKDGMGTKGQADSVIEQLMHPEAGERLARGEQVTKVTQRREQKPNGNREK